MAWTDATLDSTIKIKDQHLIELRSAVETLNALCGAENVTYNPTRYTTNKTSYNSTAKSLNSGYQATDNGVYSGNPSGYSSYYSTT